MKRVTFIPYAKLCLELTIYIKTSCQSNPTALVETGYKLEVDFHIYSVVRIFKRLLLITVRKQVNARRQHVLQLFASS